MHGSLQKFHKNTKMCLALYSVKNYFRVGGGKGLNKQKTDKNASCISIFRFSNALNSNLRIFFVFQVRISSVVPTFHFGRRKNSEIEPISLLYTILRFYYTYVRLKLHLYSHLVYE